jgi:UDP-2,4-diacetamido-2,4,6-trideoxy-beta-L-altropyranose hydrolase
VTQPLAVFRADGSASIGLGHLVRCAALAEALAGLGWHCVFAVSEENATAADATLAPHWPICRLPGTETEAATLRARFPLGCRLLVVDHYGRDAAFERACRGWAERILVIDDLADRQHDADVLLDQTPGRAGGAYDGLVPDSCRRLIGVDFALLRPQFRRLRSAALARRTLDEPPRRLLVSLGGGDPQNLTKRVLDAAQAFPLEVDVVIGAAAPHRTAIETRARNADGRVRVHTHVDAIGALMRDADLAVGAAGMSAWERCCLGLPSLILVAADNQRPGARFIAEAEAGLVIDEPGGLSPTAIAEALCRLIDDATLRRHVSYCAASLCDGRGVQRTILGAGEPVPARDGRPVTLRLAEPDDAMLLYRWQCAPETRRYARHPAVPTLDEHFTWFDAALADEDRFLTVIAHDGAPAGVLRWDRLDTSPAFEVSINVAPERHGLGIAGAALRAGQALMPGARLVAEVDPANTASRRLFAGAGFVGTGPRHFAWTAPAATRVSLERAFP